MSSSAYLSKFSKQELLLEKKKKKRRNLLTTVACFNGFGRPRNRWLASIRFLPINSFKPFMFFDILQQQKNLKWFVFLFFCFVVLTSAPWRIQPKRLVRSCCKSLQIKSYTEKKKNEKCGFFCWSLATNFSIFVKMRRKSYWFATQNFFINAKRICKSKKKILKKFSKKTLGFWLTFVKERWITSQHFIN